jgi:hypothetical protein
MRMATTVAAAGRACLLFVSRSNTREYTSCDLSRRLMYCRDRCCSSTSFIDRGPLCQIITYQRVTIVRPKARRLLLVALEIHPSPLEARMTRRLIGVLASALLLISGVARAQTPPANTGTTSPIDLNWQVSTNGGSSWIQAFKVINPLFPTSGFIPPNWQANTAGYSWISATATGSGGGGNYLFRTMFSLAGFDPSSAVLSFLCVVDNLPANNQYSLNHGAFTGTCGHQSLYDFTGTQTLASGFSGGNNTLTFHVTGDSKTDGLLVANTDLTANSSVPEPTTIALLGTGLVGIFGVVRRRRDSRLV